VKAFLKNNFLVLFIYLISISIALFFIFTYKKTTIHIYMNQFVGNPVLNFFFYYITYLGDGAVAGFILLLILLYNTRLGIYATASFLTATLFSIFLKNFFFDDVNRPYFIFSYLEPYKLRRVEGLDLFIHNSFPSGHATQAFSIFMCLVFVSRNQLLKLLFFGLAMLTALSRVYLSQHWLADIIAGSAIGLLFSCLYYYIFIVQNKLPHLNKPVMALKKS
jgi:membrane-associated phospholipid phosphatase